VSYTRTEQERARKWEKYKSWSSAGTQKTPGKHPSEEKGT